MRLPTDTNSLEDIRKTIKDRFADFNQHSVASTGRRYPAELQELTSRGFLAGLKAKELTSLSGMSLSAVTYAARKLKSIRTKRPSKHVSKVLAPRCLELVSESMEHVSIALSLNSVPRSPRKNNDLLDHAKKSNKVGFACSITSY